MSQSSIAKENKQCQNLAYTFLYVSIGIKIVTITQAGEACQCLKESPTNLAVESYKASTLKPISMSLLLKC